MSLILPIMIFGLLFAPGLRLLSIAASTRRMPELLASLFFLGTAVGVPLRLIGHRVGLETPGLAMSVTKSGHLLFGAGVCALTLFTFHVFRPKTRWAQVLTTILLAVQCGCTALVTLFSSWASEESAVILLTNLSRVAPFCWAFAESLAYWRMMRRRLALGLADPVVTNRFLLWSVWTGALAILPLSALLLRLATPLLIGLGILDGLPSVEGQMMMMSCLQIMFLITGLAGSIAISLSFFPPSRYLNWIRTQSQPKAASDFPSVQV